MIDVCAENTSCVPNAGLLIVTAGGACRCTCWLNFVYLLFETFTL